jgi:hypothetical protein
MGNGRSKTMHRLHLAITILAGSAGTGVARASPNISLEPNPLDFFEIVVGQSGAVPYSVTNTGPVQLVVTDMQITGPDADQFHFETAIDPFCGDGRDCTPNFKLAPGASRSFYVACAPTHPGFFTSTLAVKSNAATSTIALTCTGDAPASMSTLVVSPASIDFGVSFAEPAFPNPHLDRTMRVTNTATAPSAPVEFQVFVPGTSGNGSFSLPGGPFGFVGPGESEDFVIEFQWFGGVLSTAPLVLQSADPSQPSIRVPMFAEAAYGRLVFDDPPNPQGFITMPAVAAGDTSILTITAHNGGDFELEISDSSAFVDFGGTGELQGSTGFVALAPGETIQWTLTCTPDGSEGFEDGASGTLGFNYLTSASEFDSFSLFCPILNAPLTGRASPRQLGHAANHTHALGSTEAPALAPVEAGASSTPQAGGCSAATPTSLAPLGLLVLGLLIPRPRIRRWRRPA